MRAGRPRPGGPPAPRRPRSGPRRARLGPDRFGTTARKAFGPGVAWFAHDKGYRAAGSAADSRTGPFCYPRRAVGRILLLTDRSPAEVLPALPALDLDVKAEPLDPESLTLLTDLAPAAVFVDAEENPEQGYRV